MSDERLTALALEQYRPHHPEDDDLPDEVVGELMAVQFIATGIAFREAGRAVVEAIERFVSKVASR